VGQQQRVEIIKALYRGAALLILDEPTAVLTPQEVDELFNIMRFMVEDGYGLIFISHKLHEVIEISHRITVLRDGHKVGTRATSDVNKKDLATWMVGHAVEFITRPEEIIRGEIRLQLQDISCESDRGTEGLSHVNLDLYSGEILGVAGVSGNGQRELAEVMAGLREPSSGKIILEGEDITSLSPDKLIKKMMSYIPEERMRDGMVKEFSVAENLILREHDQLPYSQYGFLKLQDIADHTGQMIEQYNVKTPSQKTLAKSLSGGNIQKIVLARELSRNPRTIIAAQPTRGLDVGAAEYVREQLLIQRQNGTAVLLISEDLDEILALSDRIAVIYEGKILAILDRDDASKDEIGLLMAGVDTRTEEVVQ
jgi:simple sugar transport system ATP-binding protein